jgi:hypothetical protein
LPSACRGGATTARHCWLPIDAKFPNEDYERLLDAQQRADATGAEEAGKKLELRIRLEAKSMADKYLEPPHTTDFAILFLPTEGLYAEVLRRPGLMEVLQRDHRVTLAGPTTLLAMLNSLQMGFRTLALEKRSSEVWQVLGAVKTEFGKFGDVLAKVRDHTQTVLNTLDKAQTAQQRDEPCAAQCGSPAARAGGGTVACRCWRCGGPGVARWRGLTRREPTNPRAAAAPGECPGVRARLHDRLSHGSAAHGAARRRKCRRQPGCCWRCLRCLRCFCRCLQAGMWTGTGCTGPWPWRWPLPCRVAWRPRCGLSTACCASRR